MAQLHNHWTYGLESPMYTHTLSSPAKPQTAPKNIHLPAPTLQDLLNPAPANEELSFICADPYGTQDLNDDESEAEDSEPIITRDLKLRDSRLRKLVDLANAKLLVRYTEPSRLTQPEKSATQPPRAAASPWSDDNWSAKDANF